MTKYLLTCFLLLFVLSAAAQKKPPVQPKPVGPPRTPIKLLNSDKGMMIKLNGEDVQKVYNGTFEQRFSTLRADSALFYIKTNAIDAFGHVVINQGDTLHIYSDKLHYEDATKTAVLTDHVKMVDKDATLTTNIFTYNTATKIGNYTDGGKLVSKDNVLTSKNGYYYAGPRDAYFRYNVVMTSPDALIKTDTLRYNAGSRITYFYGPTNIFGKKDKDTLYTENGTYNTKTEQAFFGKKNRYSQGTKSLKGDSLFYDKLKGYGRAIKNITFEDTEQHMMLKGDLGEYYKKDDRAVATINPYVIFITEQKDTTKNGTDSVKVLPVDNKGKANEAKLNSNPDGIKDVKLIKTADLPKGLPSAKADSLAKSIAALPNVANTVPISQDRLKDTVVKSAAAIVNTSSPNIKNSAQKNSGAAPVAGNKPSLKVKPSTKNAAVLKTDSGKTAAPEVADSTRRLKRDTMYIGADTLETQIVTYKYLKDLQEQRRLAGIRDTSSKPRKPFVLYTAKTIPKVLTAQMPAIILTEPNYKDKPLFIKPKAPTAKADTSGAKALLATKGAKQDTTVKKSGVSQSLKPDPKKKLSAADSLKLKLKPEILLKNVKPPLSDTARVRILSAHHNVHIFKSDLQGKSDSLFYSSSDSIIRSFIKPMYWTQGAQMSGDTIFLQLKNKKADNMEVFPNAMVVYIEKKDSTHFNQMGGKRLNAYFKDSKLSRATVKGNAETIYYNRKKEKVTEMQRSISSGITINMKNGEAANLSFVTKPEHTVTPVAKLKEDDKILKNFVWKPKERPASKEDVIRPKKPVPEKKAPAKTSKAPVTSLPKAVLSKDSSAVGQPKVQAPKAAADKKPANK